MTGKSKEQAGSFVCFAEKVERCIANKKGTQSRGCPPRRSLGCLPSPTSVAAVLDNERMKRKQPQRPKGQTPHAKHIKPRHIPPLNLSPFPAQSEGTRRGCSPSGAPAQALPFPETMG